MRQKRNFGWVAASCLVALGLGCGRSSLIDTGEDAFGNSASVAGASAGGSRSVSAGGKAAGSSGFGGRFGDAGTPGAGFFSGGVASAGFPNGGVSSEDCQLATGDCRRDSDVKCLDAHEACEGALLAQRDFGTTRATVRDVATSADGRVVIAGDFVGVLDLGGKSAPLVSGDASTTNTDAFVAAFDALGNADWAYAFSSDGVDTASGVRFTPNGDVVTQGKSGPMAFVIWLNARGEATASTQGRCETCEPGRVAVDNDGNVVLGGSYSGELFHAGASLSHAGSAGYLIKLDRAANLLWARNVVPDSWTSAVTTGVAIDDEDNIVVVGNGEHDTSEGAFLQKRSSRGEELFTQQLQASKQIKFQAVAVDRKMQIVVAGQLRGQMSSGGETLQSSNDLFADPWWARYDRDGQLAVQRVYSTNATGVRVNAVVADPFGNVLLSGVASTLEVAGLMSPKKTGLFVLKLRSDANGVWLRTFAGHVDPSALATDNQGNTWVGSSFTGKLLLDTDLLDAMGNPHGLLFKLSP